MAVAVLPISPASAAVSDVCPVQGQTNPFIDVDGSVHEDNIHCAEGLQLVEGTTPTTYNPTGFLTRGQAASILVNYVEVSQGADLVSDGTDDFDDDDASVHEENIEKAVDNGILVGFPDGTYRPDANITRAQFASIAVQATELILEEDLVADGTDDFDDDDGNIHESNIEKGVDNGLFEGTGPRTFSPNDFITRGQTATIIINAIGNVLVPAGAFAPAGPRPGQPNVTFTGAPELRSVTVSATEGDVVIFEFDEPIPGQELRFQGVTPGRVYQDFRLYDPAGNAYFPNQASVSGSTVIARFASVSIVDAASRAGVAFDAVEDAQGIGNVEGDFALQPASIPATPFEAFSPQLADVTNFRLAGTIEDATQRVLVDFVFNAASGFAEGDLGTGFFLVGSNGALYEGLIVEDVNANGTVVTVQFANDLTVVPESQLRRGFVEYPVGVVPGDFIILSEDYANTGGITVDPDLLMAEAVQGSAPDEYVVRYEFDEAISDLGLDETQFFLYDADGNTISADSVARSAVVADAAEVVLATFDLSDGTVVTDDDFVPVGAFLEDSAVIATDNTATANGGGNRPDEQDLMLPATPPDTTFPAGVTALPDLISVSRSQNVVTGNYTVAFTFDDDICAVAEDVAFDLYDAAGTQFRVDDVAEGQPGVTCYFTGPPTARTFTVAFSVDQGLVGTQFDNEQIAAAVTGAAEDQDNFVLELNPSITEGQVGLTSGIPAVTGVGVISPVDLDLDTDGDGIPDVTDTDDDGDTFSDADEIAAGSDPLDPASVPAAPDTTAPSVTAVSSAGGAVVTFTANEGLNCTTFNAVTAITETADETFTVACSGTTVTVTFIDPLETGESVTLEAGSVADAAGNTGPAADVTFAVA